MATIVLAMVQDSDFDPDFWVRIGVGHEWDVLTAEFAALDASIEDNEDITITVPARNVDKVRQLIDRARRGEFGRDVQVYWASAQEITPDD